LHWSIAADQLILDIFVMTCPAEGRKEETITMQHSLCGDT
jgi:hypothetical protein